MHTTRASLIASLRAALYDGPATLPAAVRRAAGSGTDVPEEWAGYVTSVRDASYRITDADLESLRAAGHAEEEVFEMTVAAATGAALHRLECGLRALGREL